MTPVLRLSDDTHRVLQEDDDAAAFRTPASSSRPARGCTYSLQVSSSQPGQTGSYVLTVTRIARDRE